jgi:hypothetical protein
MTKTRFATLYLVGRRHPKLCGVTPEAAFLTRVLVGPARQSPMFSSLGLFSKDAERLGISAIRLTLDDVHMAEYALEQGSEPGTRITTPMSSSDRTTVQHVVVAASAYPCVVIPHAALRIGEPSRSARKALGRAV